MPLKRTKWICKQCGESFINKYERRIYCSKECFYESVKGKPYLGTCTGKITYNEKKCEHCGETYIPTSGKQKTCGECKFYCITCEKEVAHGNEYCRSCWQLGDRNNSKTEEARKKLSIAARGPDHVNGMKGKKHKRSTKRLMSFQRTGSKNGNFGKITYGTGRCKWFDYYSPIAGNVRLQGTYELRMAHVLDKLGWKWRKTSDRFIYDNGNHCYIPDFKIHEREGDKCLFYIDTKGWFSESEQIKIAKIRQEHSIILLIVDLDTLNEYERRVA